MNICYKTIPHEHHRYPTVGDYWYPTPEQMEVRVSDMQNENYEFLVLIHELIEAHLCRQRGISERSITDFDVQFEIARAYDNIDEPGDSPDAPYQKEHQFATKIERQVAEELGVDWEAYDNTVVNL